MNTKNMLFVFFLTLLALGFQDSGASETTDAAPAITGIPIDEELAGLLSQVVPCELEEEQFFLLNLNKLINEDLAEQSEEYRLAACKLALRQALAITKKVGSIAVRWNPFTEAYGLPREKREKGLRQWVLGGVIEDHTAWDGVDGEATALLFTLKEGKIIDIDVGVIVYSCGGMFTDCCAGSGAFPPGLDDAWFQHFVDLGREEDFPVVRSVFSPGIVKYLHEKKTEHLSLHELYLQESQITPEGIANLAVLEDLKSLTVDIRRDYRGDDVRLVAAKARRAAFFELFPKLPQLNTLTVYVQSVTEAEMQKLIECENLTHLTLGCLEAETPEVFALFNRMKKLEKLVVNGKQVRLTDGGKE